MDNSPSSLLRSELIIYPSGQSSFIYSSNKHFTSIYQANHSAHPNIIQHPHLPRPLLLDRRPNLVRRQYEPASRLVPWTQLHGPRVLSPMHSIMVISGVSRGKIQNLAPRPILIRHVPGTGLHNGPCSAARDLQHARQGFGQRVAGEAVRRENQLAVRVKVDERADSSACFGERGREAVEGGVLRRVAWCFATVRLAAGIGRGAAVGRRGVPFKLPVAIAVGAQTRRVEAGTRLPVLAP